MNIIWKGADQSNYQIGRKSAYTNKQYSVQGIVLHWMDGTLVGTDSWFNNPQAKVSANYGIGDDQIHQYVKDTDTAYQAGRYEPDATHSLANLNTIGIEHQGSPKITISDQTYESSAQLVALKCKEYAIPCDRDHIKAHNEVSKVATSCPGNLDVDRIVKRAQEILAGQIGQSAPTNATINTMFPLISYPTTVEITATIGVHVRTSPYVKSDNIATAMNYGTNVSVEGYVNGEIPSGTNNGKWWQLVEKSANGSPLFIWCGGTNIPDPTVTPAASIQPTPTPLPPVVDAVDTTSQVSDLEKEVSDLQNKLNQTNSQLEDITAKYNPFSAMGYASVDDVTKALNDKDKIITDTKTELTQVQQRNIDLLDTLKKKEEEDYTAVQDGIAAVKQLGALNDGFMQIVKELGISKPGIDAIINQIQFYKSSANKARNDAINAQNKLSQALSSDNLKQVEKTGMEWLLGILHLH